MFSAAAMRGQHLAPRLARRLRPSPTGNPLRAASATRHLHSPSPSAAPPPQSAVDAPLLRRALLSGALIGACALSAPSRADAGLAVDPVGVPLGLTVEPETGAPLCLNVEPETGVPFAGRLGSRDLLGAGPRLMGGIVRVYALGVYAPASCARAALARHIGVSADALLADRGFWDAVCTRVEEVTLRLVVVREVGARHMQTGVERGLKKCRAEGTSMRRVKEFAKMFARLGTMKVGSEVLVRCEGDVLSLVVDGREVGSMEDRGVRESLMRMFLGEQSVTPDAKKSVAEGLARILVDVNA